jgi:hypothetical protein
MEKKRQLAGFFRQIQIISWKNALLFLQNKSGIITELITCVLFISIMGGIIAFASVNRSRAFDDNTEIPTSFYDGDVGEKLYFYPETNLTLKLISKIFDTVKIYTQTNLTGFEGIDKSDPSEFTNAQFKATSIFISFSTAMLNATRWPDSIQYSLFLKKSSQTIEMSNDYRFNLNDIPKYLVESRYGSDYYDKKVNTVKNSIDVHLINSIMDSEVMSFSKMVKLKFAKYFFHFLIKLDDNLLFNRKRLRLIRFRASGMIL